jgi:hypothetical protein
VRCECCRNREAGNAGPDDCDAWVYSSAEHCAASCCLSRARS